MSKPRKGDTVIDKSMTKEWTVIESSIDSVWVKNERNKRRWIKLDRLECVDHDDGIWQEMVS